MAVIAAHLLTIFLFFSNDISSWTICSVELKHGGSHCVNMKKQTSITHVMINFTQMSDFSPTGPQAYTFCYSWEAIYSSVITLINPFLHIYSCYDPPTTCMNNLSVNNNSFKYKVHQDKTDTSDIQYNTIKRDIEISLRLIHSLVLVYSYLPCPLM